MMEMKPPLFVACFLVAAITCGAHTCGKLREIEKGDTCLSLSQALNLTLQDFMLLNPKTNCSSLIVGEEICASSCFRKLVSPRYGQRPVVMDYIGAMGNSTAFDDVPVSPDVDHFFILSFAIDANRSGIVQNGSFISYWSDGLTPESVSAIKSKHQNVKVLLSLAGYSLQVDGQSDPWIVRWYDPSDADLWIDNAVKSISALVQKYHLDGVDIDYESMDDPSNLRLFPFCIGELIKALKRNKVISVATIAPYGASAPYYRSLLRYYGDQFDYINFQFYSYSNVTNAYDYVQLYHWIAQGFDENKLMVSLEIDGTSGRGVQGAEFFKAVEEIKKTRKVPGMFLWSAEGSQETGFLVEKVAQCTL
ncbi:chitinase 2-like [Selaginella moellendorffii]|uniref:chitinase 2-like n=1 Tax=Selaginella moellendorffii TaxID=88036 RepID=UPI000D1CD857|nr:chitinase 2-like [Selaginella moellendorffii]|eukprot:XP_024542454.1 chitinase 2-like [Selaginella moellendorffii]